MSPQPQHTPPAPDATQIYAHSRAGQPKDEWESLPDHLRNVGEMAGNFASAFGWEVMARLSGELHDIGKISRDFQDYIDGKRAKGGDHSSMGACIAQARLPRPFGQILATIIAAHHAGLADGVELQERLKRFTEEGNVPANWENHAFPLPSPQTLVPLGPFDTCRDEGFGLHLLIRMMFSCLVDADFLETEAFYGPIERGIASDPTVLRDRLRLFMAAKGEESRRHHPSELNTLRAEILDHAVGKAAMAPGLFTLTVPTGGGKTLASLSFALEHAVRHGLRRIVYVIPYTSIIEQTAAVFREALQEDDAILEHHSSFDWEDAARSSLREDDEGPNGIDKLKRAAENWDAPVIVTTAVQFFESLYANRSSRCRKLHNIAGSVIVLDEVQTLPLGLLRPCMAAMEELARNYNTSLVLCTATQPALREKDGFRGGFQIDETRELAPDPQELYTRLKRVNVERLADPVSDETIAARFAEQPQMLCIVNTRKHAQDLFDRIRDLPGAAHLTTLMCPRHRRMVLETLRQRLEEGEPVRLVATSLIEAGIDISFPEVWRAAVGIDSIAQAAGRCNREGRLEYGRVMVFEPLDHGIQQDLKIRWQTAQPVFRTRDDVLGLDAVLHYFKELYWQKGDTAFDTAKVKDQTGILEAIRTRSDTGDFPFASIAQAFLMIDDTKNSPIVVPWKADAEDDAFIRLIGRMAGMDKPRTADLRALQQYTVPIPKSQRDEWLVKGVIQPVHRALGDSLLMIPPPDLAAYYDVHRGVILENCNLNVPEQYVI